MSRANIYSDRFDQPKVRPKSVRLRLSRKANAFAWKQKLVAVNDQQPVDRMPALSAVGPASDF